jgi:hypothetical protein
MQATSKRITAKWWGVALSLFVLWNGLLILAYGLNTVSRTYCVTYMEMATGVGQALTRVAGALFGS